MPTCSCLTLVGNMERHNRSGWGGVCYLNIELKWTLAESFGPDLVMAH